MTCSTTSPPGSRGRSGPHPHRRGPTGRDVAVLERALAGLVAHRDAPVGSDHAGARSRAVPAAVRARRRARRRRADRARAAGGDRRRRARVLGAEVVRAGVVPRARHHVRPRPRLLHGKPAPVVRRAADDRVDLRRSSGRRRLPREFFSGSSPTSMASRSLLRTSPTAATRSWSKDAIEEP